MSNAGRGPLRVVIADDQRVVRDGLVTILGAMDGVQVVGAAEDGAGAVALATEHDADVVLMDLRMPGVDGVEATRALRASHPATAVVVLTTYTDDESILGALQAGAAGFLTKNAGPDDIRRALEAAVSGQAVLDAAAAARLVLAAGREPAAGRPGTDGPSGALPDGLTEREGEVLALIARGLSNAEIAGQLFVSRSTVKTHINQIFAKTSSRDRAQAIVYANRHGLTPPD
ncbi:MAG TPA: response regulator transcription factor [Streptosporangiaceae bacterium]|jgi:DNA-binding NarL/FixJ family response regulator|nr:response regulator transcription factor [Streptosporangiaceae bacterium]